MEPGALSVIYRLLVFSPRSVDDLEAGLQVVDFSFIYTLNPEPGTDPF
jgi:hypothetical protein